MDLQKFHKIDENLTSSEVAQLKFLCMDLIPKKRLETVTDAKELFLRLDEQALLDEGLLVPELLITIGRLDLLGILEMSKDNVERNLLLRDTSSKGVSAYRKMLFSISEDITEENLHTVKFLVELPRGKLGTSATFLDVMIEMEKLQKLGEDNLDELYCILDNCDKQLACRIEEYRAREQVGGRLPLREVSGNVQVSFPDESMPRYQMETENGWRRSSLVTDSDTEPRMGEYYNMTLRPLGYCLIINNFNFKERSSLSNRTGTDKDKDDLSRVFRRMHFEVEVQDDLTASACQGNEGQDGVLTMDAPGKATEEDPYEEDAYNPAARSIPIESDMLIGMATVERYQSYRHTKNGSIYIQELCNQLEKFCPRKEDILSILTKVNREVSLKMLRGHKQMPEPRYTLTKKLVLPMD
ncbi:caspase-8-like isoform X3 [Sinocyclocheilus anshuiensis]|uniref:caspase-8-like isoform X3 n=1 Tax=Sinocyclocheilus anshuiensis TaxID=1608454 RepID=UPI0007B87A46|nr:PREDICTED: caspase-8-like isoform X3 [Sinocyclocheilus anshuiensis]